MSHEQGGDKHEGIAQRIENAVAMGKDICLSQREGELICRALRSARREKEIAFARAVLDNLPYLENLITQRGHESALMLMHPSPCTGHDFCLMRQAQKGADAIREAGLEAANAAERDEYVPGGSR